MLGIPFRFSDTPASVRRAPPTLGQHTEQVLRDRLKLSDARTDSPVAKFLERNPAGGIHHFCPGVDSVDAAAEALGGNGVRVLCEGRVQHNVHGERIVFVHPSDFPGALVEREETPAAGIAVVPGIDDVTTCTR